MAESSKNFPENEIKTEGQQKAADFSRHREVKNMVINAPIADCLAVTGQIDGQGAVFLLSATGEPGLQIGEPLPTLGFTELVPGRCHPKPMFVPPRKDYWALSLRPFFFRTSNPTKSDYTPQPPWVSWNGPSEGAKQYAGESQDGRKPPQAYQEIRFKLAEMFTLFQTSQWMLYRAAWLLEARMSEGGNTWRRRQGLYHRVG